MRKPSAYEWIALGVVAALCAAWLLTGIERLRYVALAAVSLYFVYRIVCNGRIRK